MHWSFDDCVQRKPVDNTALTILPVTRLGWFCFPSYASCRLKKEIKTTVLFIASEKPQATAALQTATWEYSLASLSLVQEVIGLEIIWCRQALTDKEFACLFGCSTLVDAVVDTSILCWSSGIYSRGEISIAGLYQCR